MKSTAQYAPAVAVLTPILYNLPGKIIAIHGRPCVGKTTFGRFLAWHFNVTLIETDLFTIRGQGRLVYRSEEIERLIAQRIDRDDPRPVLIEGAAVMRALDGIGRVPDFLIQIINPDAPESGPDLEADLAAYDRQFNPGAQSDLVLVLTAAES